MGLLWVETDMVTIHFSGVVPRGISRNPRDFRLLQTDSGLQ
jgi:hypothetical protein